MSDKAQLQEPRGMTMRALSIRLDLAAIGCLGDARNHPAFHRFDAGSLALFLVGHCRVPFPMIKLYRKTVRLCRYSLSGECPTENILHHLTVRAICLKTASRIISARGRRLPLATHWRICASSVSVTWKRMG